MNESQSKNINKNRLIFQGKSHVQRQILLSLKLLGHAYEKQNNDNEETKSFRIKRR